MVHAGLFKRIFLELPCLSLPPLQPTPFLLLTFISLLFFLFPRWHCLYPARRFGQHCQLTSSSRQNPAAKCLLLHLELKNYHAICDTKSTNNRLFVSQLELTSTSIHILIAQICVHSCMHSVELCRIAHYKSPGFMICCWLHTQPADLVRLHRCKFAIYGSWSAHVWCDNVWWASRHPLLLSVTSTIWG